MPAGAPARTLLYLYLLPRLVDPQIRLECAFRPVTVCTGVVSYSRPVNEGADSARACQRCTGRPCVACRPRTGLPCISNATPIEHSFAEKGHLDCSDGLCQHHQNRRRARRDGQHRSTSMYDNHTCQVSGNPTVDIRSPAHRRLARSDMFLHAYRHPYICGRFSSLARLASGARTPIELWHAPSRVCAAAACAAQAGGAIQQHLPSMSMTPSVVSRQGRSPCTRTLPCTRRNRPG